MATSRYEVFIRVAELGSLTRAAEALGCTQSNASHIVSTLEEEFGFALFSRGRSGTRLTPDGERILPAVRALRAAEERLRQTVAAIHGLDAGLVRIGAFTSVAVHWLPGMLRAFTEDYPGIEIGLSNGDYHDVEQWLSEGSIDLGFVTLPTKLECRCFPLYEDRVLMVVPPGHRLADAPYFPLKELENEPFISLLEGSDQDMRRVLAQAGVRPQVRFTTKDDYAILAMVENGLGVSILPELLLRGHAADVRVLELETHPVRTIALALPDSAETSPCTARFAEYVRSWVRAHETENE